MSNIDIVVDTWITSDEVKKGTLNVKNGEVKVVLDSGKVISGKNKPNITYSLLNYSGGPLNRIFLNPILVTELSYSADIGQVAEDIFPPSSGGFYGRIRSGKEKAVFIIQKIVHDTRLWLIIGNSQTGKIFETQIIQPYEAEALGLTDDQEILESWDNELWSDKRNLLEREILNILDEPSPHWDIISKLFVGADVSDDLVREKTIQETLTQLVPDSFPENARVHLMAFLAYVMMDRIEIEDLLDPSSHLYAAPMFSALIQGHLRSKVDNIKWPPYLDLIQQSASGQIGQPKRTLPETADSSLRVLWQKMIESFPKWFGTAISSAQELNEANKVRLRLPITKYQAMKSKRLMKKRIAAMTYGLRVGGHVNPKTIGLSELVYVGVAYRWPHRHMRYITRLGEVSDNPPHLQVITAPPSAVERIIRTLPTCIKIAWSKRAVNLTLYDIESDSWNIPIEKILTSANEPLSQRRIVRRFGSVVSPKIHQVTSVETKVLGIASSLVNLEDFEFPGYFNYWDLTRKNVSSIIMKLQKEGVLDISYEVADPRLVSLATIIQGNNEQVTSIVNALLSYAPTSVAMLNEQFDTGVVMSKFPEDIAYILASKLTQLGLEAKLGIRCMRPRTFRSYTSTLYHRLLQPDSTWDDDVSAFLSQARSKRRELSESNA
ncbi:MAG: hypothetical protein ACFFEM_11625 [Candidatus Thorarchaeota archaeon]